MARTQAADYDKKREAITGKAAVLFARSGFAGASISELASVCSVSKSLIYHYYESKEEILYGVMSEHIDELISISEEPIDADTAQDEFLQYTRSLLTCYAGAADSQKVLLYELEALPTEYRAEIVEKQRRLIKRVEDILGRCKPGIAKKSAQLRTIVMLYFGMLNWTQSWFNPKGPVTREQLADMAVEMTLSSL